MVRISLNWAHLKNWDIYAYSKKNGYLKYKKDIKMSAVSFPVRFPRRGDSFAERLLHDNTSLT